MVNPIHNCRLSGESLDNARVLFEIPECPFPGIYPVSFEESQSLKTPLRVLQARHSGFVQLAHTYEASLYGKYSFAGGGSLAYRAHIASIVADISKSLPKKAQILEIGCGDGLLVNELYNIGFKNIAGIDPGRALHASATEDAPRLISGFFPQDMPAACRCKKYDLIITRHVLEHIENPQSFVADMVAYLAPSGQLWIEVPDLRSTVEKQLWTNFYQLHCNYFSAKTLDRLLANNGLSCLDGCIVDIFGGSLLRKYTRSQGTENSSEPVEEQLDIRTRIKEFVRKLDQLALRIPAGTPGYGAAERTAATLGFSPRLTAALGALHDKNALLHNRYLAGTMLRILPPEHLYANPAPALLLFAISNTREILAEWKNHLPENTQVALITGDMTLKPLKDHA